jgi:hypothetical protein
MVNPTNVSAWLFAAAGGFHLLIGVLTVGYLVVGGNVKALYFTERSDTGAFGKSPAEMVRDEPGVATYRHMFIVTLAAFLVAVGTLEAAVAWFALRDGAAWSLPVLTAVAVALAAGWTAVVAAYVAKGAALGLGDVPPFMWVPAVLHVPAIAMGWWGRLGG